MKVDDLAEVALNGPFLRESLGKRLLDAGCDRRFCNGLVKDLIGEFGEGGRPSLRAVSLFLEINRRYLLKRRKGWELPTYISFNPEMAPDERRSRNWRVPEITSTGDLARWLEADPSKLDWYVGQNGTVDPSSKLSHYVLETKPKRSGALRLLEKPKPDLKRMQRFILDGILSKIPGNDSSHGFRKGRSIFSFVEPHVGRRLIIKMDLKDYFLSVGSGRVRALFHLAGYPPRVSSSLMGICMHRIHHRHVPAGVIGPRRYENFHLPQGSPSSPALADRSLYFLDVRLTALAEKMHMHYTRYADDLAFSTDDGTLSGERVKNFLTLVDSIIREEGFSVNNAKTRVMPNSQRQALAGLVVNEKTNLVRSEFDTLKAILHRCSKNGLEAENRSQHPAFLEHLQGRVEFLKQANPKRGGKLMALLRQSAH